MTHSAQLADRVGRLSGPLAGPRGQLEVKDRGLWEALPEALSTLRSALLEAEGREEGR